MRTIKITILAGLLTALTTGCDSFLDVTPDSRSNLNSTDKVYEMLVSCYPTKFTAPIFEHRTDNVMDNGPRFEESPRIHVRENYHWKANTGPASEDNTLGLWDECYSSIANANILLDGIKKLGDGPELQAAKGEALICRAYSHFLMVNTFAPAYSSTTAKSALGIPYATKVESKIGTTYKRESLQANYDSIMMDISKGLPLIDDAKLKVPAYHFNSQAAYAFATKVALYAEQWDKAIQYATQALGPNPAPTLRSYKELNKANTPEEWGRLFISENAPCNYLIVPMYSTWFREIYAARYGVHSSIMSSQILLSSGPWGSGLPLLSKGIYNFARSAAENNFLARYYEIFEYSDIVAGIGYTHVVDVPFSSDMTLLFRAEAYVLTKQYDLAARDLNMWYNAKGAKVNLSAAKIAEYYEEAAAKKHPVAKPLHPKFELEPGLQTNLIQAVLHARRIESIHTGQRWEDIKRYGIEITHNVARGSDITLTTDDPRRAIEIPSDVITAGLPANRPDRNPVSAVSTAFLQQFQPFVPRSNK